MRYLITGKNGQLARAFIERFERSSVEYTAPDESMLDITDRNAVADTVRSCRPDVILNCAAYNQVDQAEQDTERAFAVNAKGPRNLAQAASEQQAFIVHFGSDYVFDGQKENGLYTEIDPVNPLNAYGKSKYSGEEFVRTECARHLVLRLSWVFGDGKQNFVHKLKSWAASSPYLKIACDEFSVPTFTRTVVDATLKAVEQGLTGTYHLTNGGYCSRYEWAKVILAELGIAKFIRPVSMDAFALPAKRPKFSAMSSETLTRKLGISVPGWPEAVRSFLQEKQQQ